MGSMCGFTMRFFWVVVRIMYSCVCVCLVIYDVSIHRVMVVVVVLLLAFFFVSPKGPGQRLDGFI